MLLSLKQIKLPCPRMLPSFAELWPLSSWDSRLDHRWANQSVEFFHPSPSCCRWSSKASLYLQASSPSCRLFFSKNQGLKRKVFWKIYIRYTIVGRLKKKQEKHQPWNCLMMFDAGSGQSSIGSGAVIGLGPSAWRKHCNLKCARTRLKTGELNGEDCRSCLDCNLHAKLPNANVKIK